ncbi:MAG: NAD(P)H-hydrate dehydratase [Gemmatimonadota bacterium]
MTAIPILTPEQAAAWDQSAVRVGMAEATLMESAGRAVAQLAIHRFPGPARQGVLVACGPGNNGGDGWVAARALQRLGLPVWVAPVSGATPSALNTTMAALGRDAGVREVASDGPWPAVGLLIDALLGTGARGAPRGEIAALSARLNELHLPMVAVDGPTGLDLLDGVSYGAPRADLSVTFGGYRRGHLLARDEVGEMVVVDIAFPTCDPEWPTLMTDHEAMEALPSIPADAHKGGRGRVVIVGGDLGLTGAARLAARSAFAAGAGLVHILAPREAVAILAQAEPDLQARVQPFDQSLTSEAVELIARADVVIVGPGLNRDPSRTPLVLEVLARGATAVVDADALTALQGAVSALALLAAERRFVLTPHAGEFRTVFPSLSPGAAVDPWGAVVAAASASSSTVLLKGVPTVVSGPAGRVRTVAAGNPGLATGGSGDTLCGLIATFLAQGLEPMEAAALGAHAMGRAADIAARRVGARALRPMDVVAALPDLWRSWSRQGRAPAVLEPPILHHLDAPARL